MTPTPTGSSLVRRAQSAPVTRQPAATDDRRPPRPVPVQSSRLRGVLSLMVETRIAEVESALSVRLYAGRTRQLEAQATFLEAEQAAIARISRSKRITDSDVAETEFHRYLHGLEQPDALAFVERDMALRRLLADRDRIMRALPEGAAGARDGANDPAFEEDVAGNQIEQMAMKAVTQFGNLPTKEAEQAFAEWEEEARRRLPRYAAAEVISRCRELRSLLR